MQNTIGRKIGALETKNPRKKCDKLHYFQLDQKNRFWCAFSLEYLFWNRIFVIGHARLGNELIKATSVRTLRNPYLL